MQQCPVGLVADGRQHLLLTVAGRHAEDGLRLIAVAGHDDLIEHGTAPRMADPQAARFARHGCHRAGEADDRPVGIQLGSNLAHVGPPSTLDCPPHRPLEDLQPAVGPAEAEGGGQRPGGPLAGRGKHQASRAVGRL